MRIEGNARQHQCHFSVNSSTFFRDFFIPEKNPYLRVSRTFADAYQTKYDTLASVNGSIHLFSYVLLFFASCSLTLSNVMQRNMSTKLLSLLIIHHWHCTIAIMANFENHETFKIKTFSPSSSFLSAFHLLVFQIEGMTTKY